MSMMEAMGMTRCEDVLGRLWHFLDGELGHDEEAAVQKHLELCDRCYPQYDFQRAYFEYSQRLRRHEGASPELRHRLFQRILEQEAAEGENGRGP